MLNIFNKITNNKFNTKTQVLHIQNDKNHVLTSHTKITWLGLHNVVKCSNHNCVINKGK